MAQEFTPPEWLQDQDADTIQRRMMEKLPADIDNTEGGFPFDFTMPTALEKAELLQFHLVETLKLMFPQWAYGGWLELHAKASGITRKPPNAAYGVVTVEGEPGTIIPAGFQFAVPAVGNTPSFGFATEAETTIGETGTAFVAVVAVEAGTTGNVPAGAIAIMAEPISGITSVTNQEPTSGGSETESDDALRERIDEKDKAAEASFVGCDADYIRWAKEVPGVGSAFVIPQWKPGEPNNVKLVVLDANGEPANEHIVAEVYDYIMSPADRLARRAPVDAILTVTAPERVTITLVLKATLRPGYSPQEAAEDVAARIQAYYTTAKAQHLLKYNEVHAAITEAPSIYDFTSLTINGGTQNIPLGSDEYPVTGGIDLGIPEEATET